MYSFDFKHEYPYIYISAAGVSRTYSWGYAAVSSIFDYLVYQLKCDLIFNLLYFHFINFSKRTIKSLVPTVRKNSSFIILEFFKFGSLKQHYQLACNHPCGLCCSLAHFHLRRKSGVVMNSNYRILKKTQH